LYGFYIYKQLKQTNVGNTSLFNQYFSFGEYFFGYKKFDKFAKDKLFKEDKQYIFGIDGVILNLKSLKNQYAESDFLKLFINLFIKEGIQFVSKFKGEFSGFIFIKETKKLYYFNNKTATKQIFYSHNDSSLSITPNLRSIALKRAKEGLTNCLDIKATYNMLTFGGMIENQTLIEDVYKLGAGAYLVFENNKITIKKYYDYNTININISEKNKAIKSINEVFIEAVKLEYEKDKEYNYQHIATLSGGLDSRMNVMLAKKLGYTSTTFCFSQSGYADETIAQKITQDLSLDLKFVALDGGDYLKNLTEMVQINSGLQFYHGSAHYHYALQQLDLSNYGLMHTGQIGDGILGGFVSKGNSKNHLSKTISTRFFDKIHVDKDILDSYRDEEVFKLYQRVFNLANFGSFVVEQNQTYLVSPFLDINVIEVALSIDPQLKINQDIYIDWINKLQPEVNKYKWERTGFRPDKKWKTAFSRYTNKIKKEYYNITNQKDKLSMNPVAYWLETNQSIQDFQNQVFNQNIHLLENNSELQFDLRLLYKEGSFMEKALVLTILELINSLKLKV
jgi:asparagine synthase (glutamine-hydrolysing)